MADYKLIAANCPNCGASLSLPSGIQRAYCTYCGSEILISKLVGVVKVPCGTCGGAGRVDVCRACNGTGRCTWFTNSPGERHQDLLAIGYSAHCDNGVCSACNGTGRYNIGGCPGCQGTGRCPKCLGSGRCAACHGTGRLANSSGNETCPECGGDGIVERNQPSAAERGLICPECKRPWVQGQTYCKYCHFKRNLCPKCGAVWITGTLSCRSCGYGAIQNAGLNAP